ncbi:Mov34/MPN/PAD-1 family protein [Luteibacter sp.]|uniref:Mov34/MPN/PAD-1 family protein n=1 Tax=Luteibacter sp. TaxID=1886636 RepID=UPI0025C72903|nr:Mov34/MPN/PAD-1 family protein [Luteibacter sp.]
MDLLVSNAARDVLHAGRQALGGIERGGLLFVDSGDARGLILSLVTPSHPDDKADSYALLLSDTRCRLEIEAANERGLRLIGFWHSHPETVPHLSGKDIASFKSFGRRNHVDMPWPVAVIVGRSNSVDGVKAWSIRPSGIYAAQLVAPLYTYVEESPEN